MTTYSPRQAFTLFTRALADGVEPSHAWAAAGLPANTDAALARAAAPDVARAIAALHRAAAHGFDPRALVERCIQWVDQAFAQGTGTQQLAAVRALAEAMRLTRALDPLAEPDAEPNAEPDAEPHALPPLLSDDEWLAKYAPAP